MGSTATMKTKPWRVVLSRIRRTKRSMWGMLMAALPSMTCFRNVNKATLKRICKNSWFHLVSMKWESFMIAWYLQDLRLIMISEAELSLLKNNTKHPPNSKPNFLGRRKSHWLKKVRNQLKKWLCRLLMSAIRQSCKLASMITNKIMLIHHLNI